MSRLRLDLGAARQTVSIALAPLQKQTLSVHGTSAHVESPEATTEVLRRGWGTTILGITGELVWAHFAPPTPVISNDESPVLSSVFFFFVAGGGAQLQHVHVYDGRRRIRAFDVVRDGDFTGTAVEGVNKWSLIYTAKQAIGISVGFQFPRFSGGSSAGPTGEVLLTAAGAEYET
jgi:hypothetical protein